MSSAYIPLSASAANLFFVVQGLKALNNLYQFGLVRYLELYNLVLQHSSDTTSAASSRLWSIWQCLVKLVYDYVGSGLLAADRLIFLLRVAEIGSAMVPSSSPPPSQYMQLLTMHDEQKRDGEPLSPLKCVEALNISQDQKDLITRLVSTAVSTGASSFASALQSSLKAHPQEWAAFLTVTNSTAIIPQGCHHSGDSVLVSLENVIISRWMRPDLAEEYLERYAEGLLGLDKPLTPFNAPSLQDSITSRSMMVGPVRLSCYYSCISSAFSPTLRFIYWPVLLALTHLCVSLI